MPINSTSNIQSSVNLYQTNQSLSQTSTRQPVEKAPETTKPEQVFTVEISQEAQDLASKAAEQQSDVQQDLEQDKAVQLEAAQQAVQENTEVKDENQQKSIDLLV